MRPYEGIPLVNFIRKALFSVLLLFLFIIALLASVDNSDPVALKFLNWQSPLWPVSLWILMAFVVGVLLGIALNFCSNMVLRLEARHSGKILADLTSRLDEIKAEMRGAGDDDR